MGDYYTMGPKEAAICCEMVNAGVAIPIHYGTFPVLTGSPEEFKSFTEEYSESEVLIPEPGSPVRDHTRAAGHPAYDGPPRKVQTWAGTDRQCRGRLLAVLRDADSPVHRSRLDVVWSDEAQRKRALEGLLEDNLAAEVEPDFFALP
jgi:hypothetical protein